MARHAGWPAGVGTGRVRPSRLFTECWLSTYAPNSSGYSKFSVFDDEQGRYLDGVTVHKSVAGHSPRAAEFKRDGYTVGHNCHNVTRAGTSRPTKRCFRIHHLEPQLEGANAWTAGRAGANCGLPSEAAALRDRHGAVTITGRLTRRGPLDT